MVNCLFRVSLLWLIVYSDSLDVPHIPGNLAIMSIVMVNCLFWFPGCSPYLVNIAISFIVMRLIVYSDSLGFLHISGKNVAISFIVMVKGTAS